ncbi:MAG: lactate racemase domain-containing protein [Myxococcaceae bacterium]
MARTLVLSGFDLRSPELPPQARILVPPPALPGLERFYEQCVSALEEPVAGPALSSWLRPGARVAVVIDDFSSPVPHVANDCRREMLEAVLALLTKHGVSPGRVSVVVANGLSRQWRQTELSELLGVAATGSYPVRSHDAEDGPSLSRVGEEPEGPVEFNRALLEADVLVHLNVVTSPLMAGLFSVVSGATGYRTARFLGRPELLANDDAPLLPGSAWHRAHLRVASHLRRQVPVVQLSAVLNNAIWNPRLTSIIRSGEGLSRPLQMWNAMPTAVRHRLARTLRASYRPISVIAGEPDAVAARALETFYRQHETVVDGQADVLVFGVPDVGPASIGAAQNPILSASLALGFVSNLFSEKPLLRKGGVIVFANPLTPVFDRKAHLPHEEFYEKVLRLERDPVAIQERFEPYFAGRPEFVSNYQRRNAFHGAHPLQSWYAMQPARRHAGRIIVAHGDPRACARLGFTHAVDIEEAIDKAHDFLEMDDPEITVLDLPPPFWVRVR